MKPNQDNQSLPVTSRSRNHTRVESLKSLKDFDQAFDLSFSLVAYVSNRFLIDHMLRVGRLLTDNDYEMMVVWGVLAHQNVAHLMPPGSVPTAILNERGRFDSDQQLRPLKLRDVAAISGIPRETVRRKLEKLAERQYIKRLEEGWVVVGDRVEPELRDFTRETVLRLAAVCDEVLTALQIADQAENRGSLSRSSGAALPMP